MAQYDTVAERMGDIEKTIQFYREHVEFPSFLQAMGDVDGKRVLDVGSGDGVYARLVAQRGAAQVVGTDSSSEMIRLAEATETAQPLGIQYHVYDVATMPSLGEFDLVIAVNVLHYSADRAMLDNMCERIAANLPSGGRLLAYVGNAETDREAAADFGFFVDRADDLSEGDPFTVTIGTNPPMSVQVHYWPAASLVRSVESAGFTKVTFEEMSHTPVSPEDEVRLGRLLKNPPGLLLSAYKA